MNVIGIAWAIDDRLGARQPYFDTVIMWIVTTLFSALAVLAFVPMWRRLKRRAHALPLTFTIALVLSFACLAALNIIFFQRGIVFTELTLVILGIITGLSVALVWSLETVRHERFLVWLAAHANRSYRFDVFISYAHSAENTAWVEEHVVAPLSLATGPDGKPLRVFFDRDAISIGMEWYKRLVDSIEGSGYFVPIYSDTYFERYYCRDEIALARLH
ncbi:MAG: hypothetical protein NVSMB64_14400 [Candidatus Velthaea sp.]